eukprot:13842660-Heterocapsa_arctica.AAC.1
MKTRSPSPSESSGDHAHSDAVGPVGQRATNGQPGFSICAVKSRSSGPRESGAAAALSSQWQWHAAASATTALGQMNWRRSRRTA